MSSSRRCDQFGKLDILVANAAHQNRKPSLEDVTDEEFDATFKTNIYSYFRLSRAALRHITAGQRRSSRPARKPGIKGSKPAARLFGDQGAINAFTKSLAIDLIDEEHPRQRGRARARCGRRSTRRTTA